MSADSPTQVLTPGMERKDSADLAARLTDDMIDRWHRGEHSCAEEYFERYPELWEEPEAAIRLIYEEICLRQEQGNSVSSEEIIRRFPQWQAQLEVLLDCHRLLDEPSASATAMPKVEEVLGEFVLLSELGRGIHGRVYLASQTTLADRLVVLKITPCIGHEHLSLARLQHTHIMPLHAVYHDAKRQLRTLCMPYFGGASLHQVLGELVHTPLQKRTGEDLIAALDGAATREVKGHLKAPAIRTSESALQSPVRQFFARVSYVQAIVWIGTCLADALRYAHERGLVHLDLKPSNVLLATDGQPLLLDFHIAQKPIEPGGPMPEGLGGTPAYMSPEQAQAMTAVKKGQLIDVAIDGRSDIYSLGLSLYESLGGPLPANDHDPIPPLRRYNPEVSVGLSDILAKCLARDPNDRYLTAGALAADLRRHLADLPLRGVRNRSLSERWNKWRRRRPWALAMTLMGLSLVAAMLFLALAAVHHVGQQRGAAEAALEDGQKQFKRQAYLQSVDSFKRGLALSENLYDGGELTEQFTNELHRAQRALAAEQLHTLVDRLRFLYGASSLPVGEAHTLTSRWREVWDKRDWIRQRRGAPLDPELEQRLDMDLLDLGIIWVDLYVRLAEPSKLNQARTEALQVLADTEAMFGSSHILCTRRQAYAQALGQYDLAKAAGLQAAELPPQTAWEFYALGRSLLQTPQDLDRAKLALDQAEKVQPGGFWPLFYQGICAHRSQRYEDARSAFRVCIALAPKSAECYYNRALAETALGELHRALDDYSQALKLDPRLAAAAHNRGLLHFKAKQYPAALDDLKHALACGHDPALTHFNIALVHDAMGVRPEAIASLQRTLAANSDHKAARELLVRFRQR